MAIDTHVARRCFLKCLILAVPGVLICSFGTAGVLYGVLPYNWNFATCVLVGSVLSATDPVAVVNLLKELGTSPMLTLLIQGESLLNDGTSIILFKLAYEATAGHSFTAGQIIAQTLRSTIGAPLFGASVGMLFYAWITAASDKLCSSSSLIQLTLTILCTYWSFLFAERVCDMSGVLSTVSACSVLAHKMWPVLVEPHTVSESWHIIETIGNTIVFFLAGVLMGSVMWTTPWSDYPWVLVIYIIMQVLRFLMLLALSPLFMLAGQPSSLKEITVMTWGGLRGMVGLALAILVKQDRAQGRLTERDGDRILFLVGAVVTLSLGINASTTPFLCRMLRMTQTPSGRNILIGNVAQRAEAHLRSLTLEIISDKSLQKDYIPSVLKECTERLVTEVKNHLPKRNAAAGEEETAHLGLAPNLHLPRSSMPFWRATAFGGATASQAEEVKQLWDRFEASRRKLLGAATRIEQFRFGKQLETMRQILETQSIDYNQLSVVREVFLESLRSNYWDQVQKGRFLAGSSEPAMLNNSVNMAKDHCATHLADWEFLAQDIGFTEADPELMKAMKSEIIGAFIEAHGLSQGHVAAYFGDNEDVDSPEEAYVIIESQTQVFEAAAMRGLIDINVQQRIKTMWMVHCLGERYRRYILSVLESGVLQAKEAEVLLQSSAACLQQLNKERRKLFQHWTPEKPPMSKLEAVLIVQREFRRSRLRRNVEVALRAQAKYRPRPPTVAKPSWEPAAEEKRRSGAGRFAGAIFRRSGSTVGKKSPVLGPTSNPPPWKPIEKDDEDALNGVASSVFANMARQISDWSMPPRANSKSSVQSHSDAGAREAGSLRPSGRSEPPPPPVEVAVPPPPSEHIEKGRVFRADWALPGGMEVVARTTIDNGDASDDVASTLHVVKSSTRDRLMGA